MRIAFVNLLFCSQVNDNLETANNFTYSYYFDQLQVEILTGCERFWNVK